MAFTISGVSGITGLNLTTTQPLPPPSIGDSYGGGYYGGTVNIFGTQYYLIVAPKATGHTTSTWGSGAASEPGFSPKSSIKGYENSAGQVALAGTNAAASYFCRNLAIGGYNDWYLPARYELDILFQNLAPTASNRDTSFGINSYSVPARTSNRSSSVPGQTAVTLFRSGNAEAYNLTYYWTSSEGGTLPAEEGGTSNGGSVGQAQMLNFEGGNVLNFPKSGNYSVRAVRKVLAA
jgi:hypothetical protein